MFVCRRGRWDIIIPCGADESCVNDPVPIYSSAKTITGFEIPGTLVAANVKKKAAVDHTASLVNKV